MPYLPLFLFPLAIFFWQLLSVAYYWNDKVSTFVRLIITMSYNPHLYVSHLQCGFDKIDGVYPTWAEEPPLSLYVAYFFRWITPLDTSYYLFLYPLLCFLLSTTGLFVLINDLLQEWHKKKPYPYLLMGIIVLTPSLYIHAMRMIPDTLALSLMIWFYVFLNRKHHFWALIFAFLAVTAKALFFAPVMMIVGSYFLLSLSKRESWQKKGKKYFYLILLSCSCLPMIGWLYYLYHQGIQNPFFETQFSLQQHTGGSNFALLFSREYWSHLFHWYIMKGISLPLFIAILIGTRFQWPTSESKKIFILSAFGIIPYILVVRAPQMTAPWYAFPFIPVLLVLAADRFFILSRRWQIPLFIGLFIFSVSSLQYDFHWSFNKIKTTFTQLENKVPLALPCHFHQYHQNKEFHEGQ